MRHLLLVDGNSLGHAAHNSPRLHAGPQETQAVFGFLRTLRALLEDKVGATPVVVWDGVSWRKKVEPAYKANREQTPEQAERRESYRSQRPFINRSLKALGVRQSAASNLEADDVIALQIERLVPALDAGDVKVDVISGDRDLIQLVRPGVRWIDPINERSVSEPEFADATDYASPHAYVLGKALVGDASDNIKGVNKIGPKAAVGIVRTWGTFAEAVRAIRAGGEAALPESLRRQRKAVLSVAEPDNVRIVTRNFALMRLTREFIPEPQAFRHLQGPPDIGALEGVCDELGFLSISRDAAKWARPFTRLHAST